MGNLEEESRLVEGDFLITPKPEYKDKTKAPLSISRNAARVMDRFFAGIASPHDLSYLTNDAVNLAYAAKRGFVGYFQFYRNLRQQNVDEFRMLLELTRSFSDRMPEPQERESFSAMFLAFGMLPEIANHEELQTGFSKSQNLQVPSTTGEILERIDEVISETSLIGAGSINHTIELINRPPLLRTYWTYQAMSCMPERTIETDTVGGIKVETLEALAEKFQNPQDR